MNSPAPIYDKQHLYELASALMEGRAAAAEQQELAELLRSNDVARDEYLAIVDLHALLATEWMRPSSTGETQMPNGMDQSMASVRPEHRGVYSAVILALAICLLVAVGWSFRSGWVQPSNDLSHVAAVNERLAVLAQESDAVWDIKKFEIGDWLGCETIRLASGIVRLEFGSGVEVTLQGPAEFGLVSLTRMNLKEGLLTANVPVGAEGFTVDTPTAEVVDLGTSFGIDLRDDGYSKVSVFDGEVEVDTRDGSGKRLLFEGDAIRIGKDRTVEGLNLDPQPFERLWPIASGITGSTETMQFLPPWPRKIRFVKSDTAIYVAVESRSTPLTAPLAVNISETGEYLHERELTPLVLAPGDKVRSYVLHYAPLDRARARQADRISASITFDRPILGVIVQHEEILASSRLFSRRGRGEGNPRRELQLNEGPNGDRITLSEDRMTLSVDLVAPGRSSDLVRVIVEDDRAGKQIPSRRQQRDRSSDAPRSKEEKEKSP